MSHMGRPDGSPNPKYSLNVCVPVLKVRLACKWQECIITRRL